MPPIRFVEKTPNTCLKIPFLQRCFPGARFVFLHRDPRETIASLIEGWLEGARSGRFVTYRDLPGGLPRWCFFLPPGWRSLSDLALKRSLGIDPGESDDARWQALTMLTDVLRHHGIERHDLNAVVGFLARTKSRLLAISLEDLLGVIDQPNIPGTVNEHPNWRQRLPLAIDEIAAAIDVPALKTAVGERTRTAT